MLAMPEITTLKQAQSIAGTLGYPSKMPGTAYGISATLCHVGAKLAKVPGSTCHECYALRGHYQSDAVKQAHAARFAGLDNPQWANAVVFMLRRAHGLDGGTVSANIKVAGWHRWHDSGDIQSTSHLAAICQVARRTPELRHWLPTREAGILAAYIKGGAVIPSNLLIRVSATMVDGSPSKAFAHTSTVHKASDAIGHVCPAPAQGNECGACRACWSRDVANVSYHVH